MSTCLGKSCFPYFPWHLVETARVQTRFAETIMLAIVSCLIVKRLSALYVGMA